MPTAFTSVQTGNFNDGITWGHTSPGTKGTDWPGLAGDSFAVAAGHTVTYNVSETNELAESTVAGLLTLSTGASTKLTMANGQRLIIANGGEVRIGTIGAVINKAYTAEVYHNETSADDDDAILVQDGGKLTIAGDPTYYGSDDETTLADNAENTDGDTVIKTTDNMSAKWNVGDEITIHIKTAYSSYSTDVILRTISSFDGGDGTLITLNATVTADSGCRGKVINVTRNVKIGKLSPTTTIGNYNTNRPGIKDANVTALGNINISDVLFTGIYALGYFYGATVSNIVVRNSYNAAFVQKNSSISGNFYSNYYGFSSCYRTTANGNFFACISGIGSGALCTINGDVFANETGIPLGVIFNVNANVYGNLYGISGGQNCSFTGKIGYDALNVSVPNTYDLRYATLNLKMRNAKFPLAGFVFYPDYRNTTVGYLRITSEHHDNINGAHRIYENFGDIIKVNADGTSGRPSVDPDGGNGDLVELSNIQSNCGFGGGCPLEAFEHLVWATASLSKTYTYKVQTTYVGITAGNLKLTGEYLDEGSGGHVTTTTNSPAISERTGDTDWTQVLAVTINPAQTGWIRLKIELFEYESGKVIWIYPKATIS